MEYDRIVVGVDPAVTGRSGSSETGIIIAGSLLQKIGQHNRPITYAHVLDDFSLRGTPIEWAQAAVRAYYQYQAHLMVAEVNNGGDLVEQVIRTVAPEIAYKPVRASQGKLARAEPISSLYEQGRVFHARPLIKLEEQMCTYSPNRSLASPDRLDALVWALTELMLGQQARLMEVWEI